jgi:hypothetical protein
VDFKYWIPTGVTVLGVGFQAWQVWLMKQQIADIPSPRSPRRIQIEKQFLRKMYRPVFLMVGLVLLSWLPYIIEAARPSRLPPFLIGWSGAISGCNAEVDTSSFVKAADKYRLFLVCRIFDPTVDILEDDKIAISKPFQITGGLVSIVIPYGPSDPIRTVAKEGTQTTQTMVLLPKDQDGTNIKRLSDVNREGGQILIPGGTLKD